MRFIIHGVGAIGGTIAVSLASAGQKVIGSSPEKQREFSSRNSLSKVEVSRQTFATDLSCE